MLKRAFWTSLAAVVVAAVFSVPATAQQQGGHYDFFAQRMTEPWEKLLGKTAPDVKLKTLAGGTFDLSSFKDKKIVVMDFWASWCPPCRILMPAFAEVAKEYKDKDVVFYAVNQGESPEVARMFLEQSGLELNVVLDREGKASEAYKVNTIPRLVIVDKDGTVQSIHASLRGRSAQEAQANAKEDLSKELDKLLKGEKLVKPDPGESTVEAKKDAGEKP